MSNLGQPSWDLSTEYLSFEDPVLLKDKQWVKENIKAFEELSIPLAVALPNIEQLQNQGSEQLHKLCWQLDELQEEIGTVLGSLHVYANCHSSVDGTDEKAKSLGSDLAKLSSLFNQASQPFALLLKRCSNDFLEQHFTNGKSNSYRFLVTHNRKNSDTLLSLEEEKLIAALSTDGHHQWGKLYNTLTSTTKFKIDHPIDGEKTIGFAQAAGMTRGSDPILRERAYRARNKALETHQETFAATLNALSGWRNELYDKRSHTRKVDFLDSPLHLNRIKDKTLDALMETTKEHRELGRKAVELQAKAQKIQKLNPWDQLAPCPNLVSGEQKALPFNDAIDLIIKAFNNVDPEMGEFANMMREKKWIEASIGENKSPGAYCTRFAKSRTPRVYMTYMGSTGDVLTLAHEIGHAFHGWKLRDMPKGEQRYCMTLAETASIFAETVVRDYLIENAESKEEKLQILYQELVSAGTMILNIPTRFDFEKKLYSQRKERSFTPDNLKQMMSETWDEWYGDSVTESDPMFWASKLHFYISGLSFYNFPYLFGYLFSQGIYAQKEKLGEKFYPFYIDVLKDTGRMTAEDLVQKHLGVDLTKPDFWRESLAIVERQVQQFEELWEE